MGRRAKNKQGDPNPIEPKTSQSKSGKRKAEDEPVKHVSKKAKPLTESSDNRGKSNKGKGKETSLKKSKGKSKSANDGENDSDWEDVDDPADADLGRHTK